MTGPRSPAGRWLRKVLAAALRMAGFAVAWLLLAGWEASYVGYGVVSVLAATGLSIVLIPIDVPPAGPIGPWRRLGSAVVLPVWFMGKSVAGGVDVAVRALRWRVDVQPAVVEARCSLPDGHARQLALLMMNLMPGTMVQRIKGDVVELHTVSVGLAPRHQWEELQRKVAPAFGLNID